MSLRLLICNFGVTASSGSQLLAKIPNNKQDYILDTSLNHSLGLYSIGDLHTNTVESAFSLLKRGIVGTWHKVSAKHLEAYLNEMSFRFNNRKTPFLFRDTLLKMLEAENVEYKELIAKDHAA